MKTAREIFDNIFKAKSAEYKINGLSEGDARRKAIITAVQTTWELYNEQFRAIKQG